MPDLPRNGFRIYISTDDTKHVEALVNGSAYEVEPTEEILKLPPGYYDAGFEPLQVD